MPRILIDVQDADSPAIVLGMGVAGLMDASVTLARIVKREAARAEAEAALRELAAQLNHPSLQIRVLVGDPAEALTAESEQGGYLLLVTARRPANGFSRRWQRKELVQLCGEAPCAVLIARGAPRPFRRILLCEGGDVERPLLNRLLAQLPRLVQPDNELSVLHVMSQISVLPGSADWQLMADADTLIGQQTVEGTLLQRDVQILTNVKTKPRPVIRHGLIVDEILAESRSGDYDLVIIGAHQTQGWPARLLSNIAAELIEQIDRPLLIIR